MCAVQLGCEMQTNIVSFSSIQQQWLWRFLSSWQSGLANVPGVTDCHYPPNKLIQFASLTTFVFSSKIGLAPIVGSVVIFTAESSLGRRDYVMASSS